MEAGTHPITRFRNTYLGLREQSQVMRETAAHPPERLVQYLWYDQHFNTTDLCTEEGHRIEILSPGWWNHQAGPDFRDAQIHFNGALHSGDVEIHTTPQAWKQHGHHLDENYDNVILHVVLDPDASQGATKANGKNVSTFILRPHLLDSMEAIAAHIDLESGQVLPQTAGRCSALIPEQGLEPLTKFIDLAAEGRLLNKARQFRQRMEKSSVEQALYESLLYACGFSQFKHHFSAIASNLPYDRARQLAQQDPLALEAGLLHLGGLLPNELPQGTSAVPHFARLRSVRREYLGDMRSLPLTWKRGGVRSTNNPERRLAGAARLIARTEQLGLSENFLRIWNDDCKPLQRRKQFEALFPKALGFWATHCTWTSEALTKPQAPIGPGRIRSIIGNVILPAGLAIARQNHDRVMEERVLALFNALPKEQDNHIIQRMIPRLFGEHPPLKLNFKRQQALIQIYQDWCESNPSCRNCTACHYMDQRKASGVICI
mgnify:CR=1 FL=1